MASKIGKQQRRKRYSEAGVLFTDAYLARVEALPDGPRAAAAGAGASATADDAPTPTHPADAFKRAMRRFTTLGSTYAEMECLQELIDILVELAGGPRAGARAGDATSAEGRVRRAPETDAIDETRASAPSPEFAPAASVFLGMLFLSNSRPIHRHLITSARRFPPAAREAAERALDEEVASALAAADDDDEASGAGRMRPLAALASVNGCQPQTGMEQRVLRRAAVPAAALVARGIRAMIDEVLAGRHTPPTEMDVAHDAIAVAYSLIQRHSDAFVGETADAKGAETAANVVAALCKSLQTSALSREAAISAAVTVAAAAGIGATAREHAAALADAFFPDASGGSWIESCGAATPPLDAVVLGPHLGTTLASEAAKFTPFGRLSAVRGLLTAASPAALSARLPTPSGAGEPDASGSGSGGWCLLVDGAIPLICDAMETPADSHHKFHASAALKAALARVRAAADARAAAAADGDPGDAIPAPADGDGDDASSEEEPLDATAGVLSDELTSRVLRILWSNWEDPLSQTVKEVQAAFEEIVDAKTGASASPEEARRFLSDAAARLLAKDASSKGRYVPLATLVPRLGARNLLAIRPEVLSETFAAMRDDSVCTAAATLVSALSARLLREMQEEHARGGGGATSASSRGLGGAKEVCVDAGGGPAVAAWRSWWIPPLLAALLSPGREKVGVANYALPALVRQDGASIVALLEGLVRGDDGDEEANDDENEANDGAKNAAKRRKTEDALESVVGFDLSDSSSSAAALGARRSAALVSVLRAARAAALLDPDCIARVSVAVSAAAGSGSASGSSAPYEVPRSLLERAVVCKDARTRMDALELACLDGRRASLPGDLELALLRRAIPVCLRGDSPAFRNGLSSMLRKLLSRIKNGCQRAATLARAEARRRAAARDQPGSDPDDGRGRYGATVRGARAASSEEAVTALERGERCAAWTRWLVRSLLASTYPGSPYERKYAALDLLNAVAETWDPSETPSDTSPNPDASPNPGSDPESLSARADALEASPYAPCLREECTTSLLGAAVDSWDKLRLSAFALLTRHPAPLAGVETAEKLEARLRWALALLRSPRVRESDAAALLVRLLFRKYALDGGWDVRLAPEPKATPPDDAAKKRTRAETAAVLLGSMCDLIESECEKAEADLLAACRQSLAHGALLVTRYMLAEMAFNSQKKDVRAALKAVFARLLSLMERVTGVALASISSPDGALIGTGADELNPDVKGGGSGQGAAAAAAAAAAATGGVGFGAYFGGDDDDAHADDVDVDDDADGDNDGGFAPKAQMVVTACWLTMKEVSLLTGELARVVPIPGGANSRALGGEEKDAGLLDPSQLKAAGEHLLRTLLVMKHNGAIEKTRVGLTSLGERLLRSSQRDLSGLPATWLDDLFRRLEREGQSIKDLIRRSAGIPFGFMAVFLAEPGGVPRLLLHSAMAKLMDIAADDGDSVRQGGVARGASEGVHVPQVHAFNILRAAFQDKELSTETTGFAARGMEVSIRAFSSPHWEVRNAATLSFASLLTKVVGFMNVAHAKSGGCNRRSVTGDDFFARFPALHPFLLSELASAATALERGAVHPSLYPILAVLSRLRPSRVNMRDNRTLDPAAFIPLVRRCSRGRPLAVRAAAARALAPLVSPEKVAATVRATLGALAVRAESSSRGAPKVGYNAAHGALLCVEALLAPDGPAAACDDVGRASVVTSAAGGLGSCAYLATESPVAATAARWLACAEAAVALADPGSPGGAACRALAWSACDPAAGTARFTRDSGGGDAARRAAAAGMSVAPADVEWCKIAARMRCALALGVGADAPPVVSFASATETSLGRGSLNPKSLRADATAAVLACLSPDLPYEARAAAMKALRDAGASKVALTTDPRALRRFVSRDALPAETRHSCARRALRLMEDWDAFADANDVEADDAEWATVSKLASASTNERVRCAALRCLGRAARRRAAKISNPDADDADRAVAEMSSLVALVRAGASPERPEDTRRAAAFALASSGALERLPPPFDASDPEAINPGPVTGEACLAAWLAAFELMEDEDEDVREVAAAAAAKAAGVASDTKTEEILRRSFRRVAARLARWPPYERYLARAAGGAPVKSNALVAAIAEMCVVRRLFDREADNHHAEALLVSQLAAEATRGRRQAAADGDDGETNVSSAMRPSAARAALDAAIESAEELAAALSSPEAKAATSDWAGGATNHEAAFAPACRVALATWALAGAAGAEARARVRARVAAVDETFARVELGPTAAAMWRAAAEATGVASKMERKEGDAYAKLHPCFLLR